MSASDLTAELLLLQADFLDELGETAQASAARKTAAERNTAATVGTGLTPPQVSSESSEDDVAELALLSLEAQKHRLEKEMDALRNDEQGIRLRLKEELVAAHSDIVPTADSLLKAIETVMEQDAAVTRRDRRTRR